MMRSRVRLGQLLVSGVVAVCALAAAALAELVKKEDAKQSETRPKD